MASLFWLAVAACNAGFVVVTCLLWLRGTPPTGTERLIAIFGSITFMALAINLARKSL